MELKYHSSLRGKKFYQVEKGHGNFIFLGTLGECRRFMKVHREKVRKHFSKSRSIPSGLVELLGADF